jgi:hypothetical protein
MRILCIDIETRPAVAYVWKMWKVDIGLDQLIDPGGIICFAAKWVGERGVTFVSDFHDGHEAVVQTLHSMLDDADAVMHWNGESFDIPCINREFMENHMGPPSPFKQIDLMRTTKKKARFISNKLDHVSQQLGHEGKVKHEGFRLWKQCLAGDEKAWGRMKRYNIRDTRLLEKVYDDLQPWVVSHPSYSAHEGERVCPRCGGDKLEARGFAILTSGKYQRLRCKDCGGWSREGKRVSAAPVMQL